MRKQIRGCVSLALAASTLWAVAAAAPAENAAEAAARWDSALPLALLRYERGDFLRLDALSLPAAMALSVTPLVLEAQPGEAAVPEPEIPPAAEPPAEVPAEEKEPEEAQPIDVRDNGVPAMTLRPGDPSDYISRDRVFVNNASSAPLDAGDLTGDYTLAADTAEPQVLIVHTHGCEAYTMPPGESYEESDDHRTLDENYNVVRVGDEMARALEEAGLTVLHDRTLHDYPSYSGAYNRSLATIEKYLADYPSIRYVFDVHRDAIADAGGNQFKLLSEERPDAAQLEFVIGSDGGGLEHPRWRENLRLAAAVQERLLEAYPTLMRPIVVRNSRYNQQAAPGSLLLEMGAAGNSLEEALVSARLFAQGFAETVKSRES